MTEPNRWFVKSSLSLLFFASVLTIAALGQSRRETPAAPPALFFNAGPKKQLLTQGEAVVFVLEIYNGSGAPVFVSRLTGHELVKFGVVGPDSKDVPWQTEAPMDSKAPSPSDFAVLQPYHLVTAEKTISLKNGTGFVFDKPGQYSVTAEYSQEPAVSLAPSVAGAKIPDGSFRSMKTAFCIEVCVLGPLPGQIHGNVSRDVVDTVQVFYTSITRYQPLGIPQGRAKKVLWPLLSKRLAEELNSLQECDDDYYRRFGNLLRANQYKPATPWLEDGLFSGPVEAATPMKFSVLSSRAIGDARVDVHLRFTHKQTYCCGSPAAYEHYEGIVTLILENNRWVIDDFVALQNRPLLHLSDGYPECRDGKWADLRTEPTY